MPHAFSIPLPVRFRRPFTAWLAALLAVVPVCGASAQEVAPTAVGVVSATDASGSPSEADSAPAEDAPRGLVVREPEAFDGYTLINPLNSRDTHLVDMDGRVVHTWTTDYRPAGGCYFLDDGHLLRTGHKEGVPRFHAGGIGGVIQELDWDGSVVWEFELASDRAILHHDIARLPNGHLLCIAWEVKTPAEAIARGRDEEATVKEGFWPDMLVEVEPTPPRGGKVVWEWHAWDHLCQDRDPAKPGFGAPADFPGRFDINADHRYEEAEDSVAAAKREELERQMRELGYVGGPDDRDHPGRAGPPGILPEGPAGGGPPPGPPSDPPPGGPPARSGDWLHTNAVDYDAAHDLVVMSSPHLGEVYVIDHSTTTAEAAGSTGGRRGHGGDLLWRWGNPRNHGAGSAEDQRLFYQHDPEFFEADGGGLGLIVFNNGQHRPGGDWSSVEELVLPWDATRGGFVRAAGRPFGPDAPAWSYSRPGEFLSEFISGAQRLPDGHLLVCEGKTGRVFEITREGRIVWEYRNPLGGEVEPSPQGGRAPPHALFRATRLAKDHPGLAGRF